MFTVVYLSLVKNERDGQGHLGCTVHGPFQDRLAADQWLTNMRRVLGSGYIRPLVAPSDTIARLSAD